MSPAQSSSAKARDILKRRGGVEEEATAANASGNDTSGVNDENDSSQDKQEPTTGLKNTQIPL